MDDSHRELELYEAACRGDGRAFARLVDPNGPYCGRRIVAATRVSLAMKVTDRSRCAELFDDAHQEALVAIWRQLPAFRRESALCTWMYGVAYNHTRGYARKPDRWYGNLEDAPIEEHANHRTLSVLPALSDDADLAERLLREIARANPIGAEALLHKFWGDRTQTEIALLLGISEATVSRSVSKAFDQAAPLLTKWNCE